ncbi:hypothetical protein DFH08DRAFT_804719 [Mycena albidolilacea]|uniref:Uncharacterized protein n=1 Tax=Mycena albidolilacea TaxID=1033008 RepID=A0AAD7AA30_9AGAR|nr:hypothetical protein DFH08DRAFT_804719 [Mycena albidolilacea]
MSEFWYAYKCGQELQRGVEPRAASERMNSSPMIEAVKTIRVPVWELSTGRCMKTVEAHGHLAQTLAWGRQVVGGGAGKDDAVKVEMVFKTDLQFNIYVTTKWSNISKKPKQRTTGSIAQHRAALRPSKASSVSRGLSPELSGIRNTHISRPISPTREWLTWAPRGTFVFYPSARKLGRSTNRPKTPGTGSMSKGSVVIPLVSLEIKFWKHLFSTRASRKDWLSPELAE